MPGKRKQTLFTFIAIAASLTLGLNMAEARWGAVPVASPTVRLTAQAADIPVPKPLPVETSEAFVLPAPPPASPDAKAIAPPPATFTGAAPVRVAPPRRLEAAAAPAVRATDPGTWAVVVGINDYPGDQYDLSYAVNDASDAVQALEMQGVDESHIMFLRDGQVTVPVLHSAIDWLVNHAGPDAVSAFFYAGHVSKVNASTEELVTSDGGRIRDTQLASWFRPLAAKQAWFAIAACYGGGFNELLGPNRVLTAAAGPDDVAYESSLFQRSYFGEYMIRRAMIEGRSNDTVQSAFSWASANLAQDYPERQPFELDQSDGHVNLRPAIAAATGASNDASASTPPPDSSSTPPPDSGGGSDPAPPSSNGNCSGLFRFC